MTNYLVQLCVAGGTLLLLSSLFPIFAIYRLLQPGITRALWTGLGTLILLAAGGYGCFLYLNATSKPNHREDALVAAVFGVAALFVVLVCSISYRTTLDMNRLPQLEHHARVDSLTELFNRGHTMSLLEEACEDAIRRGTPVSLLLLDVDDFKAINDTFGHPAGDTVLREMALLLANLTRKTDFAGRYGGEEFIVVLTNTASIKSTEIAERLRSQVEAMAFSLPSSTPITITVSIGVATSHSTCNSAEHLLAEADMALYTAKRNGKNRIATAPPSNTEDKELSPTANPPKHTSLPRVS